MKKPDSPFMFLLSVLFMVYNIYELSLGFNYVNVGLLIMWTILAYCSFDNS